LSFQTHPKERKEKTNFFMKSRERERTNGKERTWHTGRTRGGEVRGRLREGGLIQIYIYRHHTDLYL